MAAFYAFYPPSEGSILPPGSATAANQVLQLTQETTTATATASIDTKTPTQGQKTMADSSPVVIASDQSAIAVTGPLTDAQLRATPVPISGTVSTTGLTDAQLRASAVPVSLTSTTITGSVAVTGPLTDTELRATPVPVSGTVSTGGLTDTELRATAVPVSIASSPLPSGAATEANQVIELTRLSGSLVPTAYDEIDLTYVTAGNGIGQIETAIYKLATVTVKTLTLTYDGSDRLSTVVAT